MMFFIRFQHVVFQIGEQRADFRVHHLVLDIGVYRQQLDDPSDDLSFRLDRLIPGCLELAELVADFLVIGLQRLTSAVSLAAISRWALLLPLAGGICTGLNNGVWPSGLAPLTYLRPSEYFSRCGPAAPADTVGGMSGNPNRL